MPIKQIFDAKNLPIRATTTPDGKPAPEAVTLEVWASELTGDEQTQWQAAKAEREAKLQAQIDAGRLTVAEDNSYIWTDAATMEQYRSELVSDLWTSFYDRWIADTQVSITISTEEI